MVRQRHGQCKRAIVSPERVVDVLVCGSCAIIALSVLAQRVPWPCRKNPPEADQEEQKKDGQVLVTNQSPPKEPGKMMSVTKYGVPLSMRYN